MDDTHLDGRHENVTILIVEDHDGVRKLLRTWLEDAFPGDRLLDVASGEEAVALATAQTPDLVLMDIQLPGMHGIEATRRIKAIAPQARVVMLTAMDDPFHRLGASAAGASAYVTKHTMRTELVPAIGALRTSPDTDGHPTSQAGPGADTNPK